MKMLTTGVVVPFGAEQGNVLHAPPITNDGQGMSFAKSFGEVAASAAGFVPTTPAEPMSKGKGAPIVKDGGASAGSMDNPLKVSIDEESKGTSTPINPARAKNDEVVAVVPSGSAQSSEKSASISKIVSVIEESTAPKNDSLQNAGIDVPVHATVLTIEEPIGPIGETAGTKADSISLSKMTQSLLAGDGDQAAVQKKEFAAAVAGKSGEEKTTKKELKDKGHFSTTVDDSKNVSMPVEGLGVHVTMTVPPGELASVAAKTQAIDVADEADSIVGAAGQVSGITGAKTSKSRSYGVDREVNGKSVSVAPKDGMAVTAKVDDGVARTKKDETDSSKTVTGMVSGNGVVEEKTHGFGVAAASAAHGVLAVTGNVSGDVVGAKTRTNINSAGMAAGQDGADVGTSGVMDGHRTLEATPTTLEVGVANGTHGWLKIRAEMADGGVVNASLSATSATGQEMLHRELSSLTAYLHEEQIGGGSVVLQTTATAGAREFAGGMENAAGREQMQQRGGQEGESRQDASGTTFSDSGEAYVQGGLGGIAEMTTHTVYAGGSWLSVRA